MNKRLLILGIALVAIIGVIAGVVWFVVLPGGNGEPAPAVVVNAPELEAADESQWVFRIDRSRSVARYQAFEEFLDASVGSPIGETSVIAGDILVEPGNPEASRFDRSSSTSSRWRRTTACATRGCARRISNRPRTRRSRCASDTSWICRSRSKRTKNTLCGWRET